PASRECAQLGGLTRHPLYPLTDLCGRSTRCAVPRKRNRGEEHMTKRLVALIGAAVIVLAACQPGNPTGAPSSGGPAGSGGASSGTGGGLAEDQTLKLYLSDTDPATMDPQAAQDSVSIAVIDATSRGLLYYDKDLNLVPALAEALPEVS